MDSKRLRPAMTAFMIFAAKNADLVELSLLFLELGPKRT